jgi:negative regulator of flagellin synthesis FlgM
MPIGVIEKAQTLGRSHRMKISGEKPYGIETYVKKVGEAKRVAQAQDPARHSTRTDKVEISAEAKRREFARIKEILEKVPDVREEKVAALKAAIENGTYEVKSKEAAEKMLREAIDEFV